MPQEFLFPLITKECFREDEASPRKYIVLPYDEPTGRPLDESHLRSIPKLAAYFSTRKSQLMARKGTMLNTWMKRGIWWACLGVGEYNFAPFKVVWEAYGKTNFRPRIFGSYNGKPWQANQAMHAFIPCSSLAEMERTGGEPDVVGQDKKSGEFVFMDCSAQSPKGRVSFCYDREALDSRKEHKPKNCVLDAAAEMGVEVLTEEEYFALQKLGEFDTKLSSWVKTPAAIRELGGAIYGDRRYSRVFIGHNGAESYYGGRGFRASLRV